MISKNFFPLITHLTHVTPISSTLRGNIFCYRVDDIEATNVITTNISDNFLIFAREKTPPLAEDVITIKYRILSDECMLKFKNELQQLNWLAILNNDDANKWYELFQSTSISFFNEHFPLQTKNISSKNNWKPRITPGIVISIHTKQRPYLNLFRTLYRHYRNLTKFTQTASKRYYRNLLESSFGSNKNVWSNINSILGKKHQSQNSSIRHNGIIVSEPVPIASTFNSYINKIPVVSVKLCIFSLLANVETGAKKLRMFKTLYCGTTREWWTDFTNSRCFEKPQARTLRKETKRKSISKSQTNQKNP